jgi:hypothetical protein
MDDAANTAGGTGAGIDKVAALNLSLGVGPLADLIMSLGGPIIEGDAVQNAVATITRLSTDKVEMAEVIEELRRQLAEGAEALTKAKATIKERTPRSPKARKAGPVDNAFSRDELRAMIADADDVEIVFSDGKKELLTIPSLSVDGDAWRDHALGLILKLPVDVKAPAERPVTVAGFALFIDGDQVAFQQRSDPLTVPPGGAVRLSDDIYF